MAHLPNEVEACAHLVRDQERKPHSSPSESIGQDRCAFRFGAQSSMRSDSILGRWPRSWRCVRANAPPSRRRRRGDEQVRQPQSRFSRSARAGDATTAASLTPRCLKQYPDIARRIGAIAPEQAWLTGEMMKASRSKRLCKTEDYAEPTLSSGVPAHIALRDCRARGGDVSQIWADGVDRDKRTIWFSAPEPGQRARSTVGFDRYSFASHVMSARTKE